MRTGRVGPRHTPRETFALRWRGLYRGQDLAEKERRSFRKNVRAQERKKGGTRGSPERELLDSGLGGSVIPRVRRGFILLEKEERGKTARADAKESSASLGKYSSPKERRACLKSHPRTKKSSS